MPGTNQNRAASATRFENAYSLVVGISGYATIRKLPYTEDAGDVASLLEDPEVCGYTKVTVLPERKATKGAIEDALGELAKVPNGSTVMIYFSGHGGHVEEGEYRGDYLLPVECAYPDEKALAESSISSQAFTGHLNRIADRADRLVVMLDCCHAGGIGDTKDLEAIPVRPGLNDGTLAALGQGKGRVIIAGARAGEPAYVLDGERNGSFTRHLLQGLRGDARGHRGVIRVVDLFDYVQEKLSDSSSSQHPVLKAEFEQNFPIALHLGGKPGSGETVKGSLGILIRLARDRTQRHVVDRIWPSLDAAREQIAFAVGLKQLHDALHDIQINQFEQILRERESLERDDLAARNLLRHTRRVTLRIKDLELPDSVRAMPDLHLGDRLADLAGAIASIEGGATRKEIRNIDQGIWEMNDVLSVVPSMVNVELKRIVRAMKLHDLFRSLLDVQDLMQQSNAEADEIRSFAAGGRDLGRLDRDIDDLMSQHDQWQKIDDLMRRIDNNGRGKPSDLEYAWSKLESLVQKQVDAVDEALRDELVEAFDELRGAIGSSDPDARVEAFRRLRSCAGYWFNTIDKRLLATCSELKPIDAALGVVLLALKDVIDEQPHYA